MQEEERPKKKPKNAKGQWLPENPRRQNWLELFLEFISHLSIDSKDTGVSPLKDNLFGSQKRFLAEVIDGLERDIHEFYCLKARQLGCSTISLAIDLFWLMVHPGTQGALVCDTEGNREKFRHILSRYIESLPKRYQVGKNKHNRSNLVLGNGSVLDYLVAGTSKRTSGGGLGRSRAYNFLHATEVSSFGNVEGVVSLFATLSEIHPDRLYIFESTAKGYNLFWQMWQKALADPITKKAFFIGWWAKDSYSLQEKSELFKRYWDGDITSEEQEQINICWKKYGVGITPQQLAWYRWKEDTTGAASLMDQEFPWDEDDAFLSTGNAYFPTKKMSLIIRQLSDNPPPFRGYAYELGDNFMSTKIKPVSSVEDSQLKIYEEPSEFGEYVIGVDSAYGRNENQDQSVIQVCRCYADRLVQVAEFCSISPESYQVAWPLAHLIGCYKNVMTIIEITGPGEATVLELKHLRELFDAGALPAPGDGSMTDLFGNARWYMYHRSDTPGAGYVYNWKCLALDTPLPTPTGWTTMRDVAEGDFLLDEQGKPCQVVGASTIFLNHECYRVTFDDGSSIVADAEHLWSVHRPLLRKNWGGGRVAKLRKTKELKPGKHTMKVAAPLELPSASLPIHPYTLGVWLGDGCSTSATYYGAPEDLRELSEHLRECGESLGTIRHRKTVSEQLIVGLQAKLRALGLTNNKHIPHAYLRGSTEQRRALLQGLMDTDGGSGGNGGRQCNFTTTNSVLAHGFAELLRTLGFKAKFCTRKRTLRYGNGVSECADAYQFWFTAHNGADVFRLKRKRSRIDEIGLERRNRWHRIVSVEPVESVPVKCVAVDSPSHLYLAGEGMVPTHNTTGDNKMAIMGQLRDSLTLGMMEVRSIQCALEMQSIVQKGFVIEPELTTSDDDRVLGLAFAHRAWCDWVRPSMIANNRTWENEVKEEKRAAEEGGRGSIVSHIVSEFFAGKQAEREEQELEDAWK